VKRIYSVEIPCLNFGDKRIPAVISKIEFSAKNLTSNAGLFLLLEIALKSGVFDLIDHDQVFDNKFTNKNEPYQNLAAR
jgi:hypothetical protein